jgi:polysaccharide export outer membrane protein
LQARFYLIVLGSLLLGGCSLLPASGPESWDVAAGQRDLRSLPYAQVKVTPEVTAVLSKLVPRLTQFAEERRPQDIRLGIGDIVSVTIFEAHSGGLFIPSEAGVRPGNYVTIPSQAVDVRGNISVPYAGNIRAKGRTTVEVQQAIVDALQNRALEPQAVLSVVEQRTSLITVLMEGTARRLPASATPERVLDVLARAGGTGGPGADMWVVLERNRRRAIAPFAALIYEQPNNVFVHPDDTIYLYREPQTFLAFGALGAQQQVPFGTWRISLAETALELGIDCTPFTGALIPVIYNINFRDPAGYFLATNFEMRNKDAIYVSNSVSVEATKAMTYFNTINSTIQGPISTAINVLTLKGLITGTGSVTTAVITGTPTP